MGNLTVKHAFSASIFLIGLFIMLCVFLKFEAVINWDTRTSEKLYQSVPFDGLFIFLSDIGSRKFFFPLLAILSMYFFMQRKFSLIPLVWINLLGVRALNTLLKGVFVRERPILEHIVEAGYYSFPSGHSMNSIAFYGLLSLLLAEAIRQKSIKTAVFVLFSFLILMIGFSRIYLGVHFPLDVLGGFIAGSAWLFFIIGIWLKFSDKSWKKYKLYNFWKSE